MNDVGEVRPLIVGEVLFDCFPDGRSVLGGAPFNVAWHLQGFGLNPLMISAVGNDTHGEKVLKAMQLWGMDKGGIQVLDGFPTGEVTVSLTDGQPSYEIRKDQAYDYIDADQLGDILREQKFSLLYHGSLITRTERSHQAINSLIDTVGVPCYIDVNLRPPWWNRTTLSAILKHARWVKLNEEELLTILEVDDDSTTSLFEYARDFLDNNDLELVIVTQGEHGAFCISRDDMISGAPVAAKVVDTVGAGDAFSAVAVLGLSRGWPLSLMLERALEFAAAICEQRGATRNDPALYKKFLKQWES